MLSEISIVIGVPNASHVGWFEIARYGSGRRVNEAGIAMFVFGASRLDATLSNKTLSWHGCDPTRSM
jgi:hypothetical protein